MTCKVFINYRRADSRLYAINLFKRLQRELGSGVFLDAKGIQSGDEYAKVIEQHIESCAVIVTVIGPRWVEILNERSEGVNEPDWVRKELARALERKVRVLPVILDDASLPTRPQLPDDLKALCDHQAHMLQAEQFDVQADTLVDEVQRNLREAAVSAIATPTAKAAQSTYPRPVPTWLSAAGSDAHGHWAEFIVKDVTQRMRWIEPGAFLMGSPKHEHDRNKEELQHRVTLTRGFWMADSACTQALWLAVMGVNPSRFTGDVRRPVENIGWDDAKLFMSELCHLVVGLSGKNGEQYARLPTEAEWEYCCRAGTDTPFYYGKRIASTVVNYDGNFPYDRTYYAWFTEDREPIGEYREATVPVKSLLGNSWALYEMHGNVNEWCEDLFAAYDDVVDRTDPLCRSNDSIFRVIRGGAWNMTARSCRSASRHSASPYKKHNKGVIGFRLCVSS